MVKNSPSMEETQFDSWVRKMPWRRDKLPTPVFWGFPCGTSGKNLPAIAGDIRDTGSIPGSGRYRGGIWQLTPACLENPMDRGARQATVHRVAKSQKREKHIPRSVDPRVWVTAHSAAAAPVYYPGLG